MPMKMVAYGIYHLLLTFTPPYYPSKCSESHAEYAPLPRIVYFVGKWAISGHPWATIFMVNEKSFSIYTGTCHVFQLHILKSYSTTHIYIFRILRLYKLYTHIHLHIMWTQTQTRSILILSTRIDAKPYTILQSERILSSSKIMGELLRRARTWPCV
jgi:hypothetical protein